MTAASVASSLEQQPHSCQMSPKQKGLSQKSGLSVLELQPGLPRLVLTAHSLSSIFFAIHSVSLSGSYAALGC